MNRINKVKDKVLREFFELLKTKKNRVSIKDVTNCSSISRSSFYRNFDSIEAITYYFFSKIYSFNNTLDINEFIDELVSSFEKIKSFKNEFQILNEMSYLSNVFDYLLKEIEKPISRDEILIDSYQKSSFISSYYSILNVYITEGFEEKVEFLKEKYLSQIDSYYRKLLKVNIENIDTISVKNMRDSDAYTIANYISSKELMFKAGLGVFNNVNWHGKIAIICGKGNNAGDGYVVAKLLKENNYDAHLFLVEEKFSEDGKYYFDQAVTEGVQFELINENTNFSNYDILVDCLLGTGFKGEPRGNISLAIHKINESKKYVVSVDINSGLNGDNGLAILAVKSNLTISIGNYKSGHYLNMAKDYILDKKNIDIGIKPLYETYKLLGSKEVKTLLKPRLNMSNKGDFGYLALIGGSDLYSGAIRLSNLANSSMAMGGGVTLLAVPNSISNNIIPNILESTIYPLSSENGFIKCNEKELDKLMSRCRSIAIGMGMGLTDETVKVVIYLLKNYKGNLIIDADGLNALARFNIGLLLETNAKIVLTPHIKELSRLTGYEIEEIQNDSINIVKEFAMKHHCILLLKGPTTIISDGKDVYLVDRGCPGMATAGSGDVLSGILASIISYNDENLLLATAGGAFINGLAGELASLENNDISMVASDTVKSIKKAINMIRKA